MPNPVRRTHRVSTAVSTILLIACGALIGVWLSSVYDVLRVSVLDDALANRLGYIGEVTSASIDPLPHGLSRLTLIIVFIAGLVGSLITYATTAVSRRRVGDPEAIAYALGCWLLGAAAGFAWLATDWPVVKRENPDVFGSFLDAGDLWVPVALLMIAAVCFRVWWVHPVTEEQEP